MLSPRASGIHVCDCREEKAKEEAENQLLDSGTIFWKETWCRSYRDRGFREDAKHEREDGGAGKGPSGVGRSLPRGLGRGGGPDRNVAEQEGPGSSGSRQTVGMQGRAGSRL